MAPQIPADAVVESASAVAAAAPAIAPPNGMGCKDALAPAITVVSKQTVRPSGASAAVGDLRLSVSDMPMLSCHYIQKGLFFPPPPPGVTMPSLVSTLAAALSRALGVFPVLAGRLVTLDDDSIVIRSNGGGDAAVEFHHAVAPGLSLGDFLVPGADVPTRLTNALFPMDRTVSYGGHARPLTSFQLTVLGGDGAVFVGLVANHAVVDGTSFWHFFNTWAGLCRGAPPQDIREPDFRRDFFGDSTAVLRFSGGVGPAVTFDADAPLRERIVHFSAAAIRELKATANNGQKRTGQLQEDSEINGKATHDAWEISSFQSLCAHIWRAVTRARRTLASDKATTFRMAVNCRHRLRPVISPVYFGNAIQSVATTATVAELATNDLGWAAGKLHATVAAHGDGAIRRAAAEWEAAPRCFPLGNPDGAALTMGSSPRFPMYDGNDFGWGRALAVRSGRANKFDGKMSAFPGQAGDGSVDVEVCLAPDTMACLLRDEEFLQYVSSPAP